MATIRKSMPAPKHQKDTKARGRFPLPSMTLAVGTHALCSSKGYVSEVINVLRALAMQLPKSISIADCLGPPAAGKHQ